MPLTPKPHTQPLEQTLLYALLLHLHSLTHEQALEAIADARADSQAGIGRNDALCNLIDRYGLLTEGLYARCLDEIDPAPSPYHPHGGYFNDRQG